MEQWEGSIRCGELKLSPPFIRQCHSTLGVNPRRSLIKNGESVDKSRSSGGDHYMTSRYSKVRIPRRLMDEISSGRCVLFLGSGASAEAGAPTGGDLARELSDNYLEGRHRDEPLARIASYIECKPGLGRQILIQHILKKTHSLFPSNAHLDLPRYPWATIYTTNYDQLVERAYAETPIQGDSVVPILRSTDLSTKYQYVRQRALMLVKLHGCISNPGSEEIPLVITEDDFRKARTNRRALFRLLESQKYTHTFLFVGYSLSDPDLGQLWIDITSELKGLTQWAYALWPGFSPDQEDLWKSRYIQLIDCTFSDFVDKLSQYSITNMAKDVLSPSVPPTIMALREVILSRLPHDRSEEIANLAILVGQRMGLSEEVLVDIQASALIHEIGKVGMPDQVLYKAGPLTPAEFSVLKNYPIIAERILATFEDLKKISKIVRSQQEQFDGSGYPDGLEGAAIPIEARILHAVKAYFSMIYDRPYRPKPICPSHAVQHLQSRSGTQFDSDIIQVIVEMYQAGVWFPDN